MNEEIVFVSFDESGIATDENIKEVENNLQKLYEANGKDLLDLYLMFYAINGASERIDDDKGINVVIRGSSAKLSVKNFKRILGSSKLTVRAICRACSSRTRDLLERNKRVTRLAIDLNLTESDSKFWAFDFADRDPHCPIKTELRKHLQEVLERQLTLRNR